MNIWEFLTHPSIQLPIKRESDDFEGFVDSLLSNYLTMLDQLSEPADIALAVKSRREDIERFCNIAPKIVRATFEGHPQDAYQHFLDGITPLNDVVEKQALLGVDRNELQILYRVRRDQKGSLTKEELFHIPFEMRHRVSTQRYSIPGLPCLYLGGSLYTCWAEMGRPPFHELHASAFWLDKDYTVSILNFSNRPKRLLCYVNPEGYVSNEQEHRNRLSTHLILWPLMALCSVVVRHRDAPYKPEYIVPQLVLQWITKQHNFDGICYFSTNVNAVATPDPKPSCNFVFPARNIIAKGRCHHLRMRLRLTSPHNWQLLSAINAGPGGSVIKGFDFEFVDGTKEPYADTEFGRVQSKLNKLAVAAWKNEVAGEGQVSA